MWMRFELFNVNGGIHPTYWEEGDLDKATSWFIANLVEFAVITCFMCVSIFRKGGCRYHQAEPVYLMLVSWISNTPDTIPANASHIVGVGALVLNKTTREAP
ncbi:hypothetical protein YC2023_067494 [Brassica napus]